MLNKPVTWLWPCRSSFKMADCTDGLSLLGDDFEAFLDVSEDTEEVEEQFALTVRNVSWKMVILSRNFALLFLNLLRIVCSTRVNKRNPANAHANIKLIYCFPSMKISCRTLLKQGILIQKLRESSKLRDVVIYLYIILRGKPCNL